MSKKKCEEKEAKPNPEDNYICKKCGLTANKEKHLCKPKKNKNKENKK